MRRGFSFAEILFAVAVLGIGFIMIAAIFPVAIGQTQAAMDETVGAAATRNGAAYLQGTPYFTAAALPATTGPQGPAAPPAPTNPPCVYSFFDPRLPAGPPTAQNLWDSVRSNLIVPDDPRFAIVPLYSRSAGATFAKVIVFGVRVRNDDKFHSDKDLSGNNDPKTAISRMTPTTVAELEPRPVAVQLVDGGAGVDHIWIGSVPTAYNANLATLSTTSSATEAAAEGAYVVISDDRVNDWLPAAGGTAFVNEYGRSNGRVYQLGANVTGTATATAPPQAMTGTVYEFELAPGQDMADNKEDIPALASNNPSAGNNPGIAFVIGRGYANTQIPGAYGGSVEVVQKFEAIVSLP